MAHHGSSHRAIRARLLPDDRQPALPIRLQRHRSPASGLRRPWHWPGRRSHRPLPELRSHRQRRPLHRCAGGIRRHHQPQRPDHFPGIHQSQPLLTHQSHHRHALRRLSLRHAGHYGNRSAAQPPHHRRRSALSRCDIAG